MPIILSALILGFVFGFNDKSEVFIPSFWLQNYIQQAVLSLLFLVLFIAITISYSKKHGVTTRFAIWSIKKTGFTKSAVLSGKGLPIGMIIPLFASVMSYGKILFAATLSPDFVHTSSSRFGKKFVSPKESELASISMIGPMSLALLGIFFSSFKEISIDNLSLIPFAIAICTMLPFPGLNGITALVGSPVRYLLAMTFILSAFFLTYILTPIQALILGFIMSIILTCFHYVYSYVFK